MDSENEQPQPLQIAKRPCGSTHIPMASSHGEHTSPIPGDCDGSLRRWSAGSDRSMGSVHSLAMADQPLTVPKRRKALFAGHGNRFSSPAATAAYAASRRALNATDNFGGNSPDDAGLDDSFVGSTDHHDFHCNPNDQADRVGSIRAQYLHDARMLEDGLSQEPSKVTPSAMHQSAPGYRCSSFFERHTSQGDEDDNRARGRARGLPTPKNSLTGFGLRQGGGLNGECEGDTRYTPQNYNTRNVTSVHRMKSAQHTGNGVYNPEGTSSGAMASHRAENRPSSIKSQVSRGFDTPFDTAADAGFVYRHQRDELSPSVPTATTTSPSDTGMPGFHPYECSTPAVPFSGRCHGAHARPVPFHIPLDRYNNFRHQYQKCYPRLDSNYSHMPPVEPALGAGPPDPQMLVPFVSITPERRSVEGAVNSFWVAIQVLARITQPLETVPNREQADVAASFEGGLYRYGYISDMNIEILPTGQSQIIEVIGKSPSLITLLPGSRRLIVAYVCLDTRLATPSNVAANFRSLPHRQRSDRLIEDLERQLGATSHEYLRVQLTYTHSGFPKRDIGRDVLGRMGGCVSVRTTIDTTATAAIMQQNESSFWSPPPTPATSPLTEIVGRYWGPAAASEMAQRIAVSNELRMQHRIVRPSPVRVRNPTSSQQSRQGSPVLEGSVGCEEVTPRAVSHEDTTPTKLQTLQPAKEDKESKEPNKKKERAQQKKAPLERELAHSSSSSAVPGRKIWGEIRRVTSNTGRRLSSNQHQTRATQSKHLQPQKSMQRLSPVPINASLSTGSPSRDCFVSQTSSARTNLEEPKRASSSRAPSQSKRVVGQDTTNFQSLAYSMSDLSIGSENWNEGRPMYGGGRSSSRCSSTASKKSGKWSWTGWFS